AKEACGFLTCCVLDPKKDKGTALFDLINTTLVSSTERIEMDLGIGGRKAIVCASSRGLGKACAASLLAEGCDVVINGRNSETLDQAVTELGQHAAGSILAVCADATNEEGRSALLAACPDPDILVTNADGPMPGSYRQWDQAAWEAAMQANMLGPTLLIRDVVDGMRERKFGRIINITSAMVKSPHPFMGLSTAARTALTAFCKGLSKEVAADNVTVNSLLPERFDTDRQEFMAQMAVQFKGLSYEEARAEMIESIAAGRLGKPSEFGDACAFLCSSQAGFISGQNLQLDGGSYDGLL
ncbi:MAG: SDR family oxidoreductase, partial [Pseudomonadota bacterium]